MLKEEVTLIDCGWDERENRLWEVWDDCNHIVIKITAYGGWWRVTDDKTGEVVSCHRGEEDAMEAGIDHARKLYKAAFYPPSELRPGEVEFRLEGAYGEDIRYSTTVDLIMRESDGELALAHIRRTWADRWDVRDASTRKRLSSHTSYHEACTAAFGYAQRNEFAIKFDPAQIPPPEREPKTTGGIDRWRYEQECERQREKDRAVAPGATAAPLVGEELDEFIFYNAPLTPEEIVAIHEEGDLLLADFMIEWRAAARGGKHLVWAGYCKRMRKMYIERRDGTNHYNL